MYLHASSTPPPTEPARKDAESLTACVVPGCGLEGRPPRGLCAQHAGALTRRTSLMTPASPAFSQRAGSLAVATTPASSSANLLNSARGRSVSFHSEPPCAPSPAPGASRMLSSPFVQVRAAARFEQRVFARTSPCHVLDRCITIACNDAHLRVFPFWALALVSSQVFRHAFRGSLPPRPVGQPHALGRRVS